MLQAKGRAPTLLPSDVFTFTFAVESNKEFGGVSHECLDLLQQKKTKNLGFTSHLRFSSLEKQVKG
jgi:hypothetical protein